MRKNLKKLEAQRKSLAKLLKQIVVKKEDSPNTATLQPSKWQTRKELIVAKMNEIIEQPSADLSLSNTQ